SRQFRRRVKLSRLCGRSAAGRPRVSGGVLTVMKKLGILSAAAFGLMMSASVAFADDITISVVGPMTGQLATIGDQFKQGAQAAADAINATGGVNGSKIKLDIQ